MLKSPTIRRILSAMHRRDSFKFLAYLYGEWENEVEQQGYANWQKYDGAIRDKLKYLNIIIVEDNKFQWTIKEGPVTLTFKVFRDDLEIKFEYIIH